MMDYRQILSITALTFAATLSGSTWADTPTPSAAATQQSSAQNTNSINRKTDRKIERRDERAEKRAITERQHAHRKHHPKTVTP